MKAFTLLFLAHCLGDYYFQPQRLAERKARSIGWVLLHSAVYAFSMALSCLLLGGRYIWAAAICAGSHCIIDVIKQIILNSSARHASLTVRADRVAFCIDQALHVGIALICAVVVSALGSVAVPTYMIKAGEAIGSAFKGDFYIMTGYAAVLLAVMKPANVFVKKMLATEKPASSDDVPPPAYRAGQKTGQYIGSLERVLIVLLLALGQYGSIAIVFTAKSIARFRQLEDRGFAEYYLTGTLLSVVTACMTYGLLRIFGTL